MTPEDMYDAEFVREMQKEAHPTFSRYCDELRDCRESGDWRQACNALEELWKAKLDPEPWMYNLAIEICTDANETEKAAALEKEVRSWGLFSGTMRFQLSPICSWQRQLKQAGCGAHNTLDWNGKEPIPQPEEPCWLLPAQDEEAEHIARWHKELRWAGWKVLTCDPELIAILRSKERFWKYVASLGLASQLPEQYDTPASAEYPCILKPTKGTWGKNTHVVYGSEEVLRMMRPSKLFEVERVAEQQIEFRQSHLEQAGYERDEEADWEERNEEIDKAVNEWIEEAEHEEIDDGWILQELATGELEYSTTLLVSEGEIMDVACSRYEFASDIYVWPALEYTKSTYVSVPDRHLKVMKTILANFSGICNFNYKIRPCGRMCIFEVNPRVGGDLVFDVPKRRVRSMLEKLDAMFA